MIRTQEEQKCSSFFMEIEKYFSCFNHLGKMTRYERRQKAACLFAGDGSCLDWYFLYAACGKGVVKTLEGLVTKGAVCNQIRKKNSQIDKFLIP